MTRNLVLRMFLLVEGSKVSLVFICMLGLSPVRILPWMPVLSRLLALVCARY
jgi:hypothetical protein